MESLMHLIDWKQKPEKLESVGSKASSIENIFVIE